MPMCCFASQCHGPDPHVSCKAFTLCAQVAALSTMKDSQRLALLKEVGGTKIYEERRRDSLKLMAESEGRQQRIQEVVRGICHPAAWAQRCLCRCLSSPYDRGS